MTTETEGSELTEQQRTRYKELMSYIKAAMPDFDDTAVVFTPGKEDGKDDSLVTIPEYALDLPDEEAVTKLRKFIFPGTDDPDEKEMSELNATLSDLARTCDARIPLYKFLNLTGPEHQRFYGYEYTEGNRLDVRWTDRQLGRIAKELGEFLGKLHRLKPAPDKAEECYTDQRYMSEAIWGALEYRKQLLPTEKPAIYTWYQRFMEDPENFRWTPVLLHHDLSSGAIFDLEGRLIGVHDWDGLSAHDAAYDFVCLYRARGREFLVEVLRHYKGPKDDRLVARVEFRCLLEDLWNPRNLNEYRAVRARAIALGSGPPPPTSAKSVLERLRRQQEEGSILRNEIENEQP